jgi:hypothetical protein
MSWGVALRNGLPLGLGHIPTLGVNGSLTYKVIGCDGNVYIVRRTVRDCSNTPYFVTRPVKACNGASYVPI